MENKSCIICGKLHKNKIACSIECRSKYDSLQKKGIKNPKQSVMMKEKYKNGFKVWNDGLTIADSRIKSSIEKLNSNRFQDKGKWESVHFKNGVGFYKKVSKSLGNKCKICGSERYVETHHIDGDRANNPEDGSNWIRLCKSHHKLVHKRNLDVTKIDEIKKLKYRKFAARVT
jgi:predicted restriction endonuclease